MKLEFLSDFEKKLSNTHDKVLLKIVLECIDLFEKASVLRDVPNVKQLKGHDTAYRYRKSKYRIGFYYEGGVIIFAAFDTRGDIYKKFP